MLKYTVAALFFGSMSAAEALQPLHTNPTVYSGFYSIGLADEVRKNCDSIEPRMIKAYFKIKSLESYARKVGYSDEQIEAFTKNKAEKEKLRARIRRDLKKRGASPESPEGYCTVGLEEIAKDSAAGRLLRAR